MASYELRNLSAYDFELLVKDLLEAELRLPLESFAPGPDGGIDIRYFNNKKNRIVIQCKHYLGSKLSNLLSVLKTEVVKVRTLDPERYLIVTSLPLTDDAKKKIMEILDPYVQTPADVIGLEALNGLITNHRKVERDHYKLWMTSTEVLKYILHSPIYNRNRVDRAIMLRKAQIYVQNKTFRKALEVLGKNHYCVISGVPGIGKTTLAEVLSLKYQARGYEILTVSTDIEDAYRVLDEESKQLFFFDDFLGSTFLEDRLKDNSVTRFIEHVAKSRNKRFILTTREYILKQAIEDSEGYARAQLKKCIVKQEDYTKKVRAHILYNHLYFSGMASDYVKKIAENRNYMKIVDHKSFSPRIVEWMTNELNVKNIPPGEYLQQFVDSLDNPRVIWRIAFEKHLSPSARSVVMLLGFVYDSIAIDDFAVLLRAWKKQDDSDLVEWNLGFKSSLRELDGTFIRIDGRDSNIIRFHNPSISDFITDYFRSNPETIDSYLAAEPKFWDQYWRAIGLRRPANSKRQREELLKFASVLTERLYLPTLELESSFVDGSRRKVKQPFLRLRQILELIKEIEGEAAEQVRKSILRLAIEEASNRFNPNSDVYFLFSDLAKVFGRDALAGAQTGVEARLRHCETFTELSELADIYDLLSWYSDDGKILYAEKFQELEQSYELEEGLHELKKTEEAISALVDKAEIVESYVIDEVRTRIDQIEEHEREDDGDDEDYSELFKERQQNERRENIEIERMFGTL